MRGQWSMTVAGAAAWLWLGLASARSVELQLDVMPEPQTLEPAPAAEPAPPMPEPAPESAPAPAPAAKPAPVAPPAAPAAVPAHEADIEYGPVPGAELLPSFSDEENRKLTAWALVVQSKVEKQWKQPPRSSSRHPVQVSIELLANGSIANVRVTQSSGDAELDRSVLIAVLKSGPLPPLKDKALFEKVRHKVVFSFRATGAVRKGGT